jgi:5-methylcytosine-specific restriction endonuclease McrA
MKQRSNYRRRRRSANLRYRAKRFDNRARADGWLAPCLKHRVESILNWVARIQKLAPIAGLSMELVRFDMQAMQDPEIHGVEYQQGELAGYELKEYLLEKWGRKCVYCDKENVPLNIDHIQARAKGGSNRVSNLTLACVRCNQKKGKKDVRDFVKDPDRLSRILAYAKKPLQDAAAVNSTRNALHRALQATGFPVETGSGAKTKWNRSNLSIPKTHALDAACVGSVPSLSDWQRPSLQVKCAGRGRYGRTKPNKYGFPKGYFTKNKKIHGFQSGDHVRATVPTGKKTGIHTGKVSIRASGSFNINTPAGLVQSINHKYCTLIQRADGYGYLIVPLSMEKVKGKGTKQRLAQQAALSRP